MCSYLILIRLLVSRRRSVVVAQSSLFDDGGGEWDVAIGGLEVFIFSVYYGANNYIYNPQIAISLLV